MNLDSNAMAKWVKCRSGVLRAPASVPVTNKYAIIIIIIIMLQRLMRLHIISLRGIISTFSQAALNGGLTLYYIKGNFESDYKVSISTYGS